MFDPEKRRTSHLLAKVHLFTANDRRLVLAQSRSIRWLVRVLRGRLGQCLTVRRGSLFVRNV